MIDQLYINEARRIRKEYLTNLFYIVEKEGEMKEYLTIIETIKDELNDEDIIKNDKAYKEKTFKLSKNIEQLKKYIIEYDNNIKKLDKDQRTLYTNIKEKHIGITDEEMQKELIASIIDIDEKFKKLKKKTLENFDVDQ